MREVGISAQLIGLLLLANAATVAVAQVPISVFAEGRRRAVMMALAGWMFLGACLLVLAAGTGTDMATAALFAAAVLVGVGECFHPISRQRVCGEGTWRRWGSRGGSAWPSHRHSAPSCSVSRRPRRSSRPRLWH